MTATLRSTPPTSAERTRDPGPGGQSGGNACSHRRLRHKIGGHEHSHRTPRGNPLVPGLGIPPGGGLGRIRPGQAGRPGPARVDRPAGRPGRSMAGSSATPRAGSGSPRSAASRRSRWRRPGVVTFDGPGADASSGYPPMRVLLGLDQQISGRLGSVDDALGPARGRAGRARRSWSPGPGRSRWRSGRARPWCSRTGSRRSTRPGGTTSASPRSSTQPHLAGSRSLALPAGGSAVTLPAGRAGGLGAAGGRLPRLRARSSPASSGSSTSCSGAPTAPRRSGRCSTGPRRAWASSRSGGPALAVQRLARQAGLAPAGRPVRPRDRAGRRRRRAGPRPGAGRPADRDPPGQPDRRRRRAAQGAGRPLRRPPPGPAGRAGRRPGGRPQGRRRPARRRRPGLRPAQGGRRRRRDPARSTAGTSRCPGPRSPRSASAGPPSQSPADRGAARPARVAVGPRQRPPRPRPGRGGLARRRRRRVHPGHPLRRRPDHPPRPAPAGSRSLGRGRRIVDRPDRRTTWATTSPRTPPLLDPPLPEGGTLERTFTLDRVPEGAPPRWCSTWSRSSARPTASSSPTWSARASSGPTSRSTAARSTT